MELIFILKPDGYVQKKPILKSIDEHFNIIKVKEKFLTCAEINRLYIGHAESDILPALQEYFSEGCSLVGLVNAEIDDFLNFSGLNTCPEMCKENTIRRLYGEGKGTTYSGLHIIRNAIHRPKTIEQNIRLHHLFNF